MERRDSWVVVGKTFECTAIIVFRLDHVLDKQEIPACSSVKQWSDSKYEISDTGMADFFSY